MPKESAQLDAVASELLRMTGKLTRRLRAESAYRDISWTQLGVMARLEANGPMTTAELAQAESIRPQSMGGVLVLLRNRGLVRRSPHPTDGRQFHYSLTAEGLRERERASAAKRTWLVSALRTLDASEQETLQAAVDLLERMVESTS